MEDVNLSPAKKAEVQHWKDLYNQAKEKNDYLYKEFEDMKKALDKKSAELEEKQSECDMLCSSNVRLEGQVEAYKFCIEHRRL